MNIIVTGASTGIGREVVFELSKDNEHRIVAIARSRVKLESLKEACLSAHGNEIDIYSGDMGEDDFYGEFAAYFGKQYRQLHVLLNNAGQLINKPFAETTRADFLYIYKINVFGAAEIVRAMLPYFDSKVAHVVNIGSMGGYHGSAKFPGLSAYSSSKAALAGLTECLAEEYKEAGIRFNCLCLGAVQTDMLSKAFPTYKAPMTAGEMGKYIAEFCVKGWKHFNGKVLPVSNSTP